MSGVQDHSLCLKMTLIENKTSLTNTTSTGTEDTNDTKYPSKLLVVIKKDSTISDLCRQIEQNIQSMGYHYLHIQYISTHDMFRLSPKMVLNEAVSNNSDLIATYSIHYTNNANNHNNDINSNDLLSLKLILQDWKDHIVNNMAQCYQVMKEYDVNQIERGIVNINLSKNNTDISKVNINMQDLMLYTVLLCTTKMKNVQLHSKATQIAYSILIIIIEKHLWTSTDKATIEFILHQLICSDYIDDDQRANLLNIGNDYVDNDTTSTIDSFKILTIDTDAVISKVRNINKIIKSVLHNALLSDNINSNATNTLISIINNPISKNILKYKDTLKCCHYVTAYHYRYINKNKNIQQSDGYNRALINLNHIAEILITKLIEQLQSVLFADGEDNEKEIHGFLDQINDDKMPQHWRQFKVIITGIDIIWKHLTRIISPSLHNKLSNDSTIMIRLRIHLLSVMFMLLENWEINQNSQMLFQHSHFSLLEEFILKWINDTNDSVEFCQIISNNKDIDNVIAWPINVQKAYFSKILWEFLDQTYKTIDTALEIIKYIIKYPILLNDDGTDAQTKAGIDFNFKKIYLQMIQTGLQKPKQKQMIIQQFTSAIISRLRFATYSNEQVLLLRLLCLFHRNCKNQYHKDKIIRYVKDIYNDGKLANLTTQSYVDLLLQYDPDSIATSRTISNSQSFMQNGTQPATL